MLFTAYDIEVNGNNVVAGLAYLEATCTTYSQSIVEDNFDAKMMTLAAHELGHSLGAEHDGTLDGTGNSCSPTLAYIMSASVTLYKLGQPGFQYNKNLWKFSPCSVSYFQTYINTLNSTNCLTTLSVGYNSSALSPYDQLNPGQVYSADAQCQNIQGNDSYLCRSIYGGNYTNLCTAFYCQISGSLYCSLSIAAERTTCGDKKWCVAGECVTATEAPSVNDTCPFGDTPGIVASGQTCSQLVKSSAFNCYNYARSCCGSCQNVYTGIIGCEYGDKASSCLSTYCAYYDNTSLSYCCKTCYVPTTTSATTRTTTTAINTTIATTPTITSSATIRTTTATTAPTPSTTTAAPTLNTTASTTLNTTTSSSIPSTTKAAPTTNTTISATTASISVFPSTPISITSSTTNAPTSTEQQEEKKTAVTLRLNYNVSSADNLSDSGTYSRYVDIVGESLREYYKRKVGQDVLINIRDIRRGSLIVEYDVIIKNTQTAQVALTKANIDLAAGENITVGGQVSGVESILVENVTVPIGNSSRDYLCTVYILISGGCHDGYRCVVLNSSPICQPITTTTDNVPVAVMAAVAGFIVVVAVVALICFLQRRCKNRDKRLAEQSKNSRSESQMTFPRPVYSSEGDPRQESLSGKYPNDSAYAHKLYPGYGHNNLAFDGELNSHYHHIDR